MTHTETSLTGLIADCIKAARAEGYIGTDRAYDLTPFDCEYVIENLGRKPTRQEWAAAGYVYVGSAHVAEE